MKIVTLLMFFVATGVAGAATASTYGQRIVAAVLMGEARGEGEQGLKAVAEVIRNRAIKFNKSPLEIVLKRGEFSSLNGVKPERLYQRYFRLKGFKQALEIARDCYNTPDMLGNRTKGATFYDHKRNRPPWLVDVRFVACIGNHNFYVPK